MAKISKYEIKRNEYNGGLCAYPTINGKQYYFDLACTIGRGNECMGFPARDGQVADWGEVYEKTGISRATYFRLKKQTQSA